jgi:hypothetical protein
MLRSGYVAFHRSHPLVGVVAETLLENALDGPLRCRVPSLGNASSVGLAEHRRRENSPGLVYLRLKAAARLHSDRILAGTGSAKAVAQSPAPSTGGSSIVLAMLRRAALRVAARVLRCRAFARR